MDRSATPEEAPGAGCGVQGCLIAAVALFAVLMIVMLVIAALRFRSPPQPRVEAVPAAESPPVAAPAPPSFVVA